MLWTEHKHNHLLFDSPSEDSPTSLSISVVSVSTASDSVAYVPSLQSQHITAWIDAEDGCGGMSLGGRRVVAELSREPAHESTTLHCTAQRNNKYRTMLVHCSTGGAYQDQQQQQQQQQQCFYTAHSSLQISSPLKDVQCLVSYF